MQERFRMFRRAGGNFYARDKITGRSESLGTSDRTQARQLLAARNQAAAQPQLKPDDGKGLSLGQVARSAHAHLGRCHGALLGNRRGIDTQTESHGVS